jgi:galactokinase
MADAVRFSAPGRINLIGEHTDYNLGFALPIAVGERTTVTLCPDDSDTLTVCSDRSPDPVVVPHSTTPGQIGGWAAYVAGVVWALRDAGHPVPGGTMSITGGVEMGAGLASSAALECAVLGALLTATGRPVECLEQAHIARRAENDYVGAPTGLLDQLAILFAEPKHAQLIDFRDNTTRSVVFDPDAHDLALLLINSHSAHHHSGGEYAARRASCERAAAALGVASLRDLHDRHVDGEEALDAMTESEDRRRARHIVTENRRVLQTVAALGDNDFGEVGRLLTESHASMRDDFGITTEHIDLIADTAVAAGALGARMTGGGFGGCVIALVSSAGVDPVREAVLATLDRAGHRPPTVSHTRPGPGAGPW